nr:putative integron gene cassette protein [uncultured bacterium]
MVRQFFALPCTIVDEYAGEFTQCYANSILSCLPTARAKLSSDSKVTAVFSGSSNRSNCERLVFIFSANDVLVRFVSAITSAICKASNRFRALADTSSSIPSSAKKSSKLLPLCLFIALSPI